MSDDPLPIIITAIVVIAIVLYCILFSIIGYANIKKNPWSGANWPDYNTTSSKQSSTQWMSFFITLVLSVIIFFIGKKMIENDLLTPLGIYGNTSTRHKKYE